MVWFNGILETRNIALWRFGIISGKRKRKLLGGISFGEKKLFLNIFLFAG